MGHKNTKIKVTEEVVTETMTEIRKIRTKMKKVIVNTNLQQLLHLVIFDPRNFQISKRMISRRNQFRTLVVSLTIIWMIRRQMSC